MFFLPYRFALDLRITPVLTTLVCCACIGLHFVENGREQKTIDRTTRFCAESLNGYEQMMMTNIGEGSLGMACPEMLLHIRYAREREALIETLGNEARRLAGYSAPQSARLTKDFLRETAQRYENQVPAYDPLANAYRPESWNPVRMITASFAHADWFHVLGNLFFFFAFAAAVEAAIGAFAYVLVFLIIALGSHACYSLAMMHTPGALPTVGLSGVVMGMMALLTFIAPGGRINCFYWIFIRAGTIAVPAWMLFLWYAGWDTINLASSKTMGEINLISHVSGAAIGYVTGFMLFRKQRRAIAQTLES